MKTDIILVSKNVDNVKNILVFQTVGNTLQRGWRHWDFIPSKKSDILLKGNWMNGNFLQKERGMGPMGSHVHVPHLP